MGEAHFAWLIEKAGFDAVQQVCGMIAGNRKLYLFNITKVLGLSIPESIAVILASKASARLCEFHTLISGNQK